MFLLANGAEAVKNIVMEFLKCSILKGCHMEYLQGNTLGRIQCLDASKSIVQCAQGKAQGLLLREDGSHVYSYTSYVSIRIRGLLFYCNDC